MSEEKIRPTGETVRVTSSAPKIKKIELLDGGRAGLKVMYTTTLSRNGVMTSEDKTTKAHRPVQREIRSYFKLIREHMLRICGYNWSTPLGLDMLLAKTDVRSVYIDATAQKFQLGGVVKQLDKYNGVIHTCIIPQVDYNEQADLMIILDKLVEESILFLNGTKCAPSRQIAIDYMISKKEMPNAEEEFEKMSKAEQDDYIKDALTSYGLVAVTNGDGEEEISEKPAEINESPKANSSKGKKGIGTKMSQSEGSSFGTKVSNANDVLDAEDDEVLSAFLETIDGEEE